MATLLDPFIQSQGFVVLDGALATELEARGANLNHALLSTLISIINYNQKMHYLEKLKNQWLNSRSQN